MTKKQNIVTVIAKKGRPNLLDDEILAKKRDGITGTRLTGGVNSQKMVIAIGNGVIKAKRKGTTGKVGPSQQFLDEEKLTFQRNISTIIEDHDIPKDLILNLD